MQRYTTTAMILHWLMAVLIVAGFGLGLIMTDIPGFTPSKLRYFSWHKWLGITVLMLAAVRLLWRLRHPAPPYASTMPNWQQNAAHHLHLMLYLLFFAVPLSGYFYSLAAGVPVVYLGILPLPVLIEPNPGLKPILKALHYWLNMALLASVALHFAAAMKHHFINHDTILKRMLP
jgi:cytochrome b561